MAKTPSTMIPLFTPAPDFRLPDTDGRLVSRDDFRDAKALLVMFLCNHCPFVVHIRERLTELCHNWQSRGVAVVAISSNDAERYPEDGPAKMVEYKQRFGFPFPYLYDASQAVALAYHAACTPDFFLFDADRRLTYRGQLDASRPGNGIPVTGEDLERAIATTLAGAPALEEQRPSLGCNIKWLESNLLGHTPNYPSFPG